MKSLVLFTLLFGFLALASEPLEKSSDVKTTDSIAKAKKEEANLEAILGIPSGLEEVEMKQGTKCVYECSLDMGVTSRQGQRYVAASIAWVQIDISSATDSCICPEAGTLQKERICPAVNNGETVEVSIPCGAP